MIRYPIALSLSLWLYVYLHACATYIAKYLLEIGFFVNYRVLIHSTPLAGGYVSACWSWRSMEYSFLRLMSIIKMNSIVANFNRCEFMFISEIQFGMHKRPLKMITFVCFLY